MLIINHDFFSTGLYCHRFFIAFVHCASQKVLPSTIIQRYFRTWFPINCLEEGVLYGLVRRTDGNGTSAGFSPRRLIYSVELCRGRQRYITHRSACCAFIPLPLRFFNWTISSYCLLTTPPAYRVEDLTSSIVLSYKGKIAAHSAVQDDWLVGSSEPLSSLNEFKIGHHGPL